MKALSFLKVCLIWCLAFGLIVSLVITDPSQVWLTPWRQAESGITQIAVLFRSADQWNCVVLTLLIALSVILLCINDLIIAGAFRHVTLKIASSFWLSGFWWTLKTSANVLLFLAEVFLFCYLINITYSAPRIMTPGEVPAGKYTVLLLGTSKYLAGTRKINVYYSQRIATCIQLHRRGLIRELIISGDSSSRAYDEVSAMQGDLWLAGMRGVRIKRDTRGFRTFDSIKRLKTSMKGRSSELLIISQGFHLQRALYLGHSDGISCWGVQAAGSMTTRMLKRELFAKTKLLLDIYVLNTQTVGIENIPRRSVDLSSWMDGMLLLFVLSAVGMAGRLTRLLLEY